MTAMTTEQQPPKLDRKLIERLEQARDAMEEIAEIFLANEDHESLAGEALMLLSAAEDLAAMLVPWRSSQLTGASQR